MEINSATSLLKPNESAMVILTGGMYLSFSSDGSGTSGNWKIKPRDVDRVIIYHRLPERGEPRADIYLADYVDAQESPEQGRYIIRFHHANKVGTTNQNWFEFANTGPQPVRFL